MTTVLTRFQILSLSHYENTTMQYTEIFKVVKNEDFQQNFFYIFLIFARNIDCGYMLEPPWRGASNDYHNLCFGAKIRKIAIPLHTPVLKFQSGV